ncbi:MAG: DUF2203 domain-containing protein [Armatimonadetes bacterium]|nr:DUF2203 domain-containing protein [Armatimonadota bacterium]
MPQFDQHFSVDQANALLPSLRVWLAELWRLDEQLAPLADLHRDLLLRAETHNVGGAGLGRWAELSVRWRVVAERFVEAGVQVKDLARGLCDFPHLREDGEEILLCWQMGEADVAWWHALDSGFSGRQPL